VPADHLCGLVAVEALRAAVPAGDHPVEGLADDRVVRRLDDHGEALPFGQHRSASGHGGGLTGQLGEQRNVVIGEQDAVPVEQDQNALPVGHRQPRRRHESGSAVAGDGGSRLRRAGPLGSQVDGLRHGQ
jgi:hypothetical protein